MLEAMSQLALDFLREELGADEGHDPWDWYVEVRNQRPELIFSYLVEAARDSLAPNYYVLRKITSENGISRVLLEQREFTDGTVSSLPFVKSTGPNDGPLGPVIKRTCNPGKEPGPTIGTNNKALKNFQENSKPGKVWADYFKYCSDILQCKLVTYQGREINLNHDDSLLDFAVRTIPERQTALLTILDSQDRLPGDVPEYVAYLQTVLAQKKYSTKQNPPQSEIACTLNNTIGIIYPNAVNGAGLGITNVKRRGIFPGLNDQEAWKKFPLSAESADLLYVFFYHVREQFMGQVAGEYALLLPYTTMVDHAKRLKFMQRARNNYISSLAEDTLVKQERRLQKLADEEKVVTSITILWADFGQKLENVRGIVTDVLPSRLRSMSEVAGGMWDDHAYPFPEYPIESDLDIAFNHLGQLLRRPGGDRTKKANNGARLFGLRRDIAANAYHGREIPTERLWEEIREISEAYLIDALKNGSFGLNEGRGKSGKPNYLTMAGWVRHICKFIYFLRRLEVYPRMGDWRYEPHNKRLKEFFADSEGRTGIDSPEKAYAFLLGTLFGRLLRVQSDRDVNVGANALTWLRRLTLTGKDLPDLHNKTWEKLSTYRDLGNSHVREIVEELAHLGIRSGTDINLNQTETGYFLILGQSLSFEVIPSREKTDTEKGEETNA